VREVDPLDIVETIREGLLVLESDLTVRFANRAFCDKFSVAQEDTLGRKLYEIGNREWDIPRLRSALQTIIAGGRTFEAFEVEQFFPSIGRRVMRLNARKVYRPGSRIEQILLAIEDDTERIRLEREHAIAHEQLGMLLQELTHRVKNSLQIIAAMVSIEARSHKSGQGKAALERVSHRIDALGHLYSKVSNADTIETVDAATYLGECVAFCLKVPRPEFHRTSPQGHQRQGSGSRPLRRRNSIRARSLRSSCFIRVSASICQARPISSNCVFFVTSCVRIRFPPFLPIEKKPLHRPHCHPGRAPYVSSAMIGEGCDACHWRISPCGVKVLEGNFIGEKFSEAAGRLSL
jgi:Histidine kinase/PAS fold